MLTSSELNHFTDGSYLIPTARRPARASGKYVSSAGS